MALCFVYGHQHSRGQQQFHAWHDKDEPDRNREGGCISLADLEMGNSTDDNKNLRFVQPDWEVHLWHQRYMPEMKLSFLKHLKIAS